MKCEVIHDLLPSYLDGTCSEETQKIVEEHLNQCVECQQLVEELRNIEGTMKETVISERKVFKKVIKKQRKNILIMLVSLILIFVMFGSNVNSEIMKMRLQNHIEKQYPKYDLILTDFIYYDPFFQGFGVGDSEYKAQVTSKKPDIHFNVSSKGYFFKIEDDFEKYVGKRYTTCNRLVSDYSNDVCKVFRKQGKYPMTLEDDYRVSLQADMNCTDEYFEENIANKLELNIPYYREVDQTIPMQVSFRYETTDDEIENYKKSVNDMAKDIIKILHDNGFDPEELFIGIYTKTQQYEIINIDCRKDIDSQKLDIRYREI